MSMTRKNLYCDYSATSPVCDLARQYIDEALNKYYNPSSLYSESKSVSKEINDVRRYIAESISCNYDEIYFTSGGSESNNWALRSLARFGKLSGKIHIISTMIEHPSVLNTLKDLESEGFKLSLVPPDVNGVISPELIKNEIRDDTCFVSVMMANNEVGTIQPIEEIGRICHENGLIFHSDAVQAVGRIPINVSKQNTDLISCSGHKFGALKGTGFLYCKNGIELLPMITGGGQEFGKRAGTENTVGIFSMLGALKSSHKNMLSKTIDTAVKKEKLALGLASIKDSQINGDVVDRLPGVLNISFKGVSGESLALLLDGDGILVSTTSACASKDGRVSHVLEAMGVPEDYIGGTIRFSISNSITDEDIDYIINSVKNNVEKLRLLN